MSTTLTRRTALSAMMLILAVAAVPAGAQTTNILKGTYVLTEAGLTPAGQKLSTLARLVFSGDGSITGTVVMQVGTSTATFDAQGTYTIDSDGTGVMALLTSITSSDGDVTGTTANYKVIQQSSGALSVLRADAWYQTSGEMTLSSSSAPKGTYYLTESASRSGTRIAALVFDGTGNVSGYQIVASLGTVSRVPVSGTALTGSSGFGTLSLSIEKTDSDTGETQAAKEGYIFVATQSSIRMLRTDVGGTELLTLSK
jgi:hypothetical protein